jgi:hypothetical protein
LTATAFCRLIITQFLEKSPAGRMQLVFRPQLGDLAIDMAGGKARLPNGLVSYLGTINSR